MSVCCFDFRSRALLVDPKGLPPVLLVAPRGLPPVLLVAVVDESLSPVSNEIGEDILLSERNNWLGNNESSSIFFTAILNCWRPISNELYRARVFGRRPYVDLRLFR